MRFSFFNILWEQHLENRVVDFNVVLRLEWPVCDFDLASTPVIGGRG
jgi:hypothetical protein